MYICFVIRTLAILLLTGFVLQIFSKQLIFADYQLNKSFIASVLCENKAKPQMHCEGKCHLKKELAADESRQQGNTSKVKTGPEILFSQLNTECTFNLSPEMVQLKFIEPVTALPQFSSSVFHPPSC